MPALHTCRLRIPLSKSAFARVGLPRRSAKNLYANLRGELHAAAALLWRLPSVRRPAALGIGAVHHRRRLGMPCLPDQKPPALSRWSAWYGRARGGGVRHCDAPAAMERFRFQRARLLEQGAVPPEDSQWGRDHQPRRRAHVRPLLRSVDQPVRPRGAPRRRPPNALAAALHGMHQDGLQAPPQDRRAAEPVRPLRCGARAQPLCAQSVDACVSSETNSGSWHLATPC